MAFEHLDAHVNSSGASLLDTCIQQVKTCCSCGGAKSLFDFTKDRTRIDGLYPKCKVCRRVEQTEYRNRVRSRTKDIPDQKTCGRCRVMKPEADFSRVKSSADGLYHYCNDCKNGMGQIGRYMRTYGLSKEEAKHFAANNVGSCEICGVEGKLVVDHCHNSGKVRGYICNACNTVLGFAKDNPETLLSAAKYLESKSVV
jgi:hypothetical protein